MRPLLIFCKVITFLFLFSPHAVLQAEGHSNDDGGNNHTILLVHFLKKELPKIVRNIVLNLPVNHLEDQNKKIYMDMLGKGLNKEVLNLKFKIQKEACIDKHGKKQAAQTDFKIGAPICFSTEEILSQKFLKEFIELHDYSINLKKSIVGLVFHELSHHYGYADKDHKFGANFCDLPEKFYKPSNKNNLFNEKFGTYGIPSKGQAYTQFGDIEGMVIDDNNRIIINGRNGNFHWSHNFISRYKKNGKIDYHFGLSGHHHLNHFEKKSYYIRQQSINKNEDFESLVLLGEYLKPDKRTEFFLKILSRNGKEVTDELVGKDLFAYSELENLPEHNGVFIKLVTNPRDNKITTFAIRKEEGKLTVFASRFYRDGFRDSFFGKGKYPGNTKVEFPLPTSNERITLVTIADPKIQTVNSKENYVFSYTVWTKENKKHFSYQYTIITNEDLEVIKKIVLSSHNEKDYDPKSPYPIDHLNIDHMEIDSKGNIYHIGEISFLKKKETRIKMKETIRQLMVIKLTPEGNLDNSYGDYNNGINLLKLYDILTVEDTITTRRDSLIILADIGVGYESKLLLLGIDKTGRQSMKFGTNGNTSALLSCSVLHAWNNRYFLGIQKNYLCKVDKKKKDRIVIGYGYSYSNCSQHGRIYCLNFKEAEE